MASRWLAYRAERGSPARLEAFSDGVLAIAITLLILDVRVEPEDGESLAHALGHSLPQIGAYAATFLLNPCPTQQTVAYHLEFVYRTQDGQTHDWSCTILRPADEPTITDDTVLHALIAAQEEYVTEVYGIITRDIVNCITIFVLVLFLRGRPINQSFGVGFRLATNEK